MKIIKRIIKEIEGFFGGEWDREAYFCPKCGKEVYEENNYCSRCGTKLDWREEIEDNEKNKNYL